MSIPQILDHRGDPLRASSEAYSAAGFGRDMASWQPMLASIDTELNGQPWETIAARSRDLSRNHGLASGAIETRKDSIVGTGLRLCLEPDFRALGITEDVAEEWGDYTEALWRQYADDVVHKWSCARQMMSQAQRLRMVESNCILFGESVSTVEWRPGRGGPWSTCFRMISPARLSNPHDAQDTERMRGGIEHDADDQPIWYNFRKALRNDARFGANAGAYEWERVPRKYSWGRPVVIHVFDQQECGQSRGIGGMASILADFKMTSRMEKTQLQASLLQATYAAVIESSLESARDAIGATTGASALQSYLGDLLDFHQGANVRFDGVKIPHLFPGEQLKLLSPQHPGPNADVMLRYWQRHMAGGLNMSYEEFSRDWSQSNYSSARAGLMQAARFIKSRRHFVCGQQATMELYAWMEEAFDSGRIKPPAGAPDFWEMPWAYVRCKWIGGGREHIDPQKEWNAIETEYGLDAISMEEICAMHGRDWKEVLAQKAREQKYATKLGLTLGANRGTPKPVEPQPPEPPR